MLGLSIGNFAFAMSPSAGRFLQSMPQTITPPSEFPKPPIAFGKIIAIGLMQPAARSSIGGLLEVEIQLFALPIVDETI